MKVSACVSLFMIGTTFGVDIKQLQQMEFIDEVAQQIAIEEERDLQDSAREHEAVLHEAGCNPCYNSSLGKNPHWNAPGGKDFPEGFAGPKTTDYTGPVTSDANVRGFVPPKTLVQNAPAPAAPGAPQQQPQAAPQQPLVATAQLQQPIQEEPLDDTTVAQYAAVISDAAEEGMDVKSFLKPKPVEDSLI